MGFYDITWTDCFQVTLKSTYRSQLIINRFFYVSSGYLGSLSNIAEDWVDYFIDILEPAQHYGHVYDSVIVTELFGERQSYEHVLTGRNGSDVAAALPAFMASDFRLISSNTRVRKGHKRFAGVTEAMVDVDGLATAYDTIFANLAAALMAVVPVSVFDFTPCLLSPANTKHTGNVISPIIGASFVGWSTQSSRKLGRGA